MQTILRAMRKRLFRCSRGGPSNLLCNAHDVGHNLQIPWGRWGWMTGPLVVELSDVTLEATSRHESEVWFEAGAWDWQTG